MSYISENTSNMAYYTLLLMRIDECDKVIKEYETIGANGSPPDLEHKKIRKDYFALAQRVRKKLDMI